MRKPLPLGISAAGLMVCICYLRWVSPVHRDTQSENERPAVTLAIQLDSVTAHNASAIVAAKALPKVSISNHVSAVTIPNAIPEVGTDFTRLTAPLIIWEKQVLPELRQWFSEANVLIAVSMLMDMCQQELEMVIEDSHHDEGVSEEMIAAVMENRHVVRDRLIEMSSGKLTKADFRAFTKTQDFAEACTNVAREKDGGL